MKRYILAVIAGGVAAFVWSSVSWMVIPWHQPTMKVFKNETAVGMMLKEAAPEPGIYTYPGWTDDDADMEKKHMEGPYVFASVVPDGVGSEMGQMMIGGFIVDLVAASFLLLLMLQLKDASRMARLRMALIAGLFVSVVPALMNWNWWHYPVNFTVVGIIDGFIGWALAGLVIATIIGRKSATV